MRNYLKEQIEAQLIETTIESCGFIYAGRHFLPYAECVKNIHSAPAINFQIAEQDCLRAYSQKAVAVFHTHLKGTAQFSDADKENSRLLGLPYIVYSMETKELDVYYPSNASPNKFVLGIWDCYGAVKFWFQTNALKVLPYVVRDMHVFRNGIAAETLQQLVSQTRLKRRTAVEHGCLLLLQVESEFMNHCAVYLKNNLLYHQLVGQLPKTEEYTKYWQDRTALILGYD